MTTIMRRPWVVAPAGKDICSICDFLPDLDCAGRRCMNYKRDDKHEVVFIMDRLKAIPHVLDGLLLGELPLEEDNDQQDELT